MSATIQDKGFVTQDNSEALLYVFDYDAENLPSGVELASVGTFVITPIEPTTLTQSSQGLVTGNRQARVLLSGGTVGSTYKVEHTVSTTETPAQIKSKWFLLRVTE